MAKDTILIVDDMEINRELLKSIFEEQYQVLEAGDGQQAIDRIAEDPDRLCLIFLDLLMPVKSGLDVLEFMLQQNLIQTIPVIMITGESTNESDEKAYEYGVSDIIYKPFAANVVMRRAKNIIELFEYRLGLEAKLKERTRKLMDVRRKLEQSNDFLVNALSSAIELKHLESSEHIRRIKYFTRLFLKYIQEFYPKYGISDVSASFIVNASALHDIGKFALPESLLLKADDQLTEDEESEMRKHTIYGCRLLEKFKQEDSEFYQYCYDICRYHHERYDGSGYPDHLAGDDIPIWAQIVSIVDVYDELVSAQVYKTPHAVTEAERMILAGECGAFSPEMLDCFELAKAELFAATEGKFSFIDRSEHEGFES